MPKLGACHTSGILRLFCSLLAFGRRFNDSLLAEGRTETRKSTATVSTRIGGSSSSETKIVLDRLSLVVMGHRDEGASTTQTGGSPVTMCTSSRVRQSSSRWRGCSSRCCLSGEGSDLKLEAMAVRSSVRVLRETRRGRVCTDHGLFIPVQSARAATASIRWACSAWRIMQAVAVKLLHVAGICIAPSLRETRGPS
jgi:hypothetical protein